MSGRLSLKRTTAIVSSLCLALWLPASPALAAPNCAAKAYQICQNGKWDGLGYASEAECRTYEKEFCETAPPEYPTPRQPCVDVPPGTCP